MLDPAEISFFSDLQTILSKRPRRLPEEISAVCGVDAAYEGDRVFASACLFEKGKLAAKALCVGTCSFPYVPGLFYLREGPFAVAAVRRLEVRPQLVCFDAHGAAHPRGAGLATICGMALGVPSVGVAKSVLVGTVEGHGPVRLVQGRRTLGYVTGASGQRRYWSPGYSVTLPSLLSIVRTLGSVCLQALKEADRSSKEARSSLRHCEADAGSLRKL